jgi:YidC/Oxa1 family membrane protein insertase
VDQRRVYLAVVLSLLVVVLYQMLVLKPYQERARQAAQSNGAAPATRPTNEASPTSSTLPTAPATPPAAPAGGLAAASGGAPVVTIETDLYTASVTTRGARLVTFRLKRFRRTVAADSPELNLVESDAEVLPLTLQFGAQASDADLVYRASRDRVVASGDQEEEVVFTATRGDGTELEKRLRVRGDRYLFVFQARIPSRDVVGLVLTPVASESALGGNQPGVEKAIALEGGSRRTTEHALTDLAKEPISLNDALWAGFSAQYFASLAMPADGTAKTVMGVADNVPVVRIDAPPTDGKIEYDVYLGPKDPKVLDRLGHGLDRVVDFGWFWFIAQPLLALLDILYRLTGNYGIAIILLTAGVKVVTLPLMQTSFRSMRGMQALQPEMQRLRERYKDDAGELQKQMMELYRKNKVNPFAGCLPMVLQIPIFVGLYNALNHAIELRHAPFVGWISDLSAPDRLMIGGVGVPVLTLLMGLSMLIQQRMTPQQGDPTQQRMMMLMPLVFTYMFINFPSGLVLYWLVNNVLTIAQQGVMLRKR